MSSDNNSSNSGSTSGNAAGQAGSQGHIDSKNSSGAAASPLLALFSSDATASVGTPQENTPIDLSGLLPVSGLSVSSSGSNMGTMTPLPLDPDIDQLMKSLGDNVDTSKVSDEDLDKLLGSISAGFSSSTPSAPVVSSVNSSEALAALSRDFGIDLSTPVGLRSSASGSLGDIASLSAGSSAFTPTPITHSSSAVVPGSTPMAAPATASLSARPGQFPTMGQQQQQLAMRPVTGRPPPPSSSQHQQHRPVSTHSTPQHTPLLGVGPVRPAGGQQSRTASMSGVTTPGSTGSSTPTPTTLQVQRPQRPQNMGVSTPRPGVRPARPMHAMQTGQHQHNQQQHQHNQQQGVRAPAMRPSRPPGTEPSKWLAGMMATLAPEQQERLAVLFRGLQAKTVDFATFVRDAEAIMGPRFQHLIAMMRTQGAPAVAPATRLPHPMQVQQQPPRAVRPTAVQHQPRPMHHVQQSHQSHQHQQQKQHTPLEMQSMAAATAGNGGGTTFEALTARWRQIIMNPLVGSEQLARLSMQFSAYGEQLDAAGGELAGLGEEARAQQFAQIAKLQALIAQRQLGSTASSVGTQSESRGASPEARQRGKKKVGRTKRRGDASADTPTAKRARGAGSDGGSDSEADTPGASSDESDASPVPVAPSSMPVSRRPTKPPRERERSGGGDAFSIDDVIGYTGVDLREESEIILGGVAAHTRVRARADDVARIGTRVVGGVHVAFDADLLAAAGLAPGALTEAVVARACGAARIANVAADVVPLLTLALHERLRAHLELATAAAHHRTRTQTLPPPPLDAATRQPLYKIAAHQDVRRQLAAVERRDRLRDQAREARVRERETAGEPATENAAEDDAGEKPALEDADDQAARRSRKRDYATPTAAYTSKNMPDDLRNKISNQTALRAAGAVRKAWMSVAPAAESDAPATPSTPVASSAAPTLATRTTPLAAPLLLTVRDCLFSLERERVGRVRVGRGGGGRVLQQAYVRHLG
ncbi:hypothetical protein GGI05_001169, partial [Coemansia sp. RSA 2603]